MGNKFASGKTAIAFCDRCGFRFKLPELKEVVVKTKKTGMLVCPSCWDPDHPQLMLGMYPVEDPQALRNPRRDATLGPGGSRASYWGWAPVGGGSSITGTPNPLVMTLSVGTVTIS